MDGRFAQDHNNDHLDTMIVWILCTHETMNSFISNINVCSNIGNITRLETFQLNLTMQRMVRRMQHVKLRTIGIQCKNGNRHWVLSL